MDLLQALSDGFHFAQVNRVPCLEAANSDFIRLPPLLGMYSVHEAASNPIEAGVAGKEKARRRKARSSLPSP